METRNLTTEERAVFAKLNTQLSPGEQIMYHPGTMTEAYGWVADATCMAANHLTQFAILRIIRTEYEGGLSAFLADTESLRMPVFGPEEDMSFSEDDY